MSLCSISEMTAKIILFLGSTRDGRLGDKVANYVKSILESAGLAVKIFGKSIALT